MVVGHPFDTVKVNIFVFVKVVILILMATKPKMMLIIMNYGSNVTSGYLAKTVTGI